MVSMDRTKKEHSNYNVFRKIGLCIWVIVCAMGMLIYRLVSWVFHNWGNLRMDELVYTMTANLKGVNSSMIKGAVIYILPLTLLVLLAVIFLLYGTRNHKTLRRVVIWMGVLVSVIAQIGSGWYFFHTIGFSEYYKNKSVVSTFIDDNYADPSQVAVKFPEKKRNLIFLFLESLEISFSDKTEGGGKEINIVPELTELALENETFSGNDGKLNGAVPLYGSTYTMAGMFAQTSGVPLTFSAETIAMSDGFVPGIVTIGDILAKEGYKNVLYIGTDASFGDRDRYFQSHGDYEIRDYNYAVVNGEISEDYVRDWWGYDDYLLYENAKENLMNLAKSDEPFNFTMLTVDTHAENGYLCKLCKNDFEDQYANVIACASKQAVEFISWVQKQDFYKNTTIVVVGDHCTMDSDFYGDIPEEYQRRIFTIYINSPIKPSTERYRSYSSMDNFPTTLASLGAEIDGDRLGLGVNLFSDQKTLLEQYDVAYLNSNLAKRSELLENAIGEKIDVSSYVECYYDDQIGRIVISVKKELLDGKETDEVYCIIHDISTGKTLQESLQEAGECYRVDIKLDYFLYRPGTYAYDIYYKLPDGLPKVCVSDELKIEKINYASPVEYYFSEDGSNLEIEYHPMEQDHYEKYWYAVWSTENGQDDLQWYSCEEQNGLWTADIDINNHITNGDVIIHLYGGSEKADTFLYDFAIDMNDYQNANVE